MPADEYFEFRELARRAAPDGAPDPLPEVPVDLDASERDLSGRRDLYPTGEQNGDRWAEVPEPLRLDWARAMLDFPPYFPGASFMVLHAQAIRADRVSSPLVWPFHAAAFHRLGFSSTDWYLLRLCVNRRLDELIERDERRFVLETTEEGRNYRTFALVAEDWADWLPLRRAGLTPMRALDLVVDGDRRSWPRGTITGDDGTVHASA